MPCNILILVSDIGYHIKEHKQVGVSKKIGAGLPKAMKHGFRYKECNMMTTIELQITKEFME